MSDSVPWNDLDPGIRAVVRLVNDNGFVTTDSGDGKSKFASGDAEAACCAMDVPNVVIRVPREQLVGECDRLYALLTGMGVTLDTQTENIDVPCIQGSYDPSGGPDSYILLLGLDDAKLASSRV